MDEAIYYYEQATKAPNARIELYSNYGVALKDRGLYDEALATLNEALQKNDSTYPDAEWNKALVYLSMGDFQNGWKSYEWRWQAQILIQYISKLISLSGKEIKNEF